MDASIVRLSDPDTFRHLRELVATGRDVVLVLQDAKGRRSEELAVDSTLLETLVELHAAFTGGHADIDVEAVLWDALKSVLKERGGTTTTRRSTSRPASRRARS
jgi:hypothetical protein